MSAVSVLLLPGWQDSGPGHWQSLWESGHGCLRVEQHDWIRPLRGDWIARLEEVVLQHVAASATPVVFAAHSLGCHLVAAWAAHSRHTGCVQGALLVAPGDPHEEALRSVLHSWWPPVLQRLPFPSTLLASRDDPYCNFGRATEFALAWGAECIDYGQAGHINADSGLGAWPDGWRRLQAMCGQQHEQEHPW
ncbi:MAG: alpha/beta hydrolase [Rhodoferax sp.]|nr:alpha/beta hydrolase [Rhodoferax sp.]